MNLQIILLFACCLAIHAQANQCEDTLKIVNHILYEVQAGMIDISKIGERLINCTNSDVKNKVEALSKAINPVAPLLCDQAKRKFLNATVAAALVMKIPLVALDSKIICLSTIANEIPEWLMFFINIYRDAMREEAQVIDGYSSHKFDLGPVALSTMVWNRSGVKSVEVRLPVDSDTYVVTDTTWSISGSRNHAITEEKLLLGGKNYGVLYKKIVIPVRNSGKPTSFRIFNVSKNWSHKVKVTSKQEPSNHLRFGLRKIA